MHRGRFIPDTDGGDRTDRTRTALRRQDIPNHLHHPRYRSLSPDSLRCGGVVDGVRTPQHASSEDVLRGRLEAHCVGAPERCLLVRIMVQLPKLQRRHLHEGEVRGMHGRTAEAERTTEAGRTAEATGDRREAHSVLHEDSKGPAQRVLTYGDCEHGARCDRAGRPVRSLCVVTNFDCISVRVQLSHY